MYSYCFQISILYVYITACDVNDFRKNLNAEGVPSGLRWAEADLD
jgi:hypothetical protein